MYSPISKSRAVVNVYTSVSQAEMLALSAIVGDFCYRSDISITYLLKSLPASVLGNWVSVSGPGSTVTADSIGLGTDDSPAFTGLNLSGLTADQLVGTDASKNLQSITLGTNLSFDGTVLNAAGGAGASANNHKQSVKATTTGALSVPFSGPITLDGISCVAGDRVLVKNQTGAAAPSNGIYVVNDAFWGRAADATLWTDYIGALVIVEQGTQYADSAWLCTADTGGVLETTDLTWNRFADPNLSETYSGWLATPHIWTYQFTNTARIIGYDATTFYEIGDRVKLTDGGVVKYFYIWAIAYGGADTLIGLWGGSDYTLSGTISYSYVSKKINPSGFPFYFNYTPLWKTTVVQPTLGDGDLYAHARMVGTEVHFCMRLRMGSTTTKGTGPWCLSWPIGTPYGSGGINTFLGTAMALDITGYRYVGVAEYYDGTLGAVVYGDSNSAPWQSSIPFTWALNDKLFIDMTYTIAR